MQVKGLRWWVITLIALATVINYIDRQALVVLWPDIALDLFPDEDAFGRKQIYANITVVFVFAYAFGQAIFGKIFDMVGTRIGFVLSIVIWSLATMAQALAKGFLSFAFIQVILGTAEAGNWPGAAKGNAEWFPTKERAFAQGIFNSGAAIGGIVAIPVIAFLATHFSWQAVFVIVGGLGLLWVVPWLIVVKAAPDSHPWITQEERDYILTGQKAEVKEGEAEVSAEDEYNPTTKEVLSHRESWGVIIASASIDPIWWLFVSWIPIYLNEMHGLSVAQIGELGWIPYVGAMFGAWFGGLFAQNRLKAGWSINKARKVTIVLGCLIMLPSLLSMSQASTPLLAVLIMAVILFGFQTSIGNVQTLPSDLFGKKAVGTLAGFSGMAAKFAVTGLTVLVPWLTTGEPDPITGEAVANYAPVFIIGASLAITAILATLFLIPRVERLKVKA